MLQYFLISLTALFLHVRGNIVINDTSSFIVNEDLRLESNWLIQTNSPLCKSLNVIDDLSRTYDHLREIGTLSEKYASEFFEMDYPSTNVCILACVDMGVPIHLVNQIFPERKYVIEEKDYDFKAVTKWFTKQCMRREVGFLSTLDNNVTIYWRKNSNERVFTGEFEKGERNTAWRTTTIGHIFELVDSVTEELLGSYQILHDSIIRVGALVSGINPDFVVTENAIQNVFSHEWVRSQGVKHTFTKVGFQKSRLPSDLFASMSAFYYNNRHEMAREEWRSKGLFVNWWEQDSHMVTMPWELKKYWQTRLKDLVEAWSNTTLELTDIYGLRQYNEGARLLTHVDRTSTHAASLIINVAQGNVAKPWPVEIYDHANRLHEIEMNEGDIVYYESAKCLHGRMRPLEGAGSYYVNLFAHYRPIDDPEWYLKETPKDHEQPLIDLTGVDIAKELSSLSPTREQLHGAEDLFSWWKRVSPSPTNAKDEL